MLFILWSLIVLFFTICSSDTSVPAGAGNSEKPTSIVGSLTDFFTGGDENEEDDIEDYTTENTKPSIKVNNIKKGSSGNVSKPSVKTSAKRKPNDDDWFSKTETTIESPNKKPKPNEDDWFSKTGTTTNSLPKKPANPKSDDWFETSPANGVSKKKNQVIKKVETDDSDSTGFSDELKIKKPKPISIKTDTTIVAKMSNSADDDDGSFIEEDD